MENKISGEFAVHSANYFVDRSDYDSVHVLLVSWRDDDLRTRDELLALRRLFETDLNFIVTEYCLPSDGTQQAKLRSEVANFITEFALVLRSLVVIYYSGHCREVNGKAQWAANYRGGPTLIWSNIQSSCFDAIGDVLLILDCCHATLFTKGQKLRGRFEVLAACAKGLETPPPGEGSFTCALLKVLCGEVLVKGTTAKDLRGKIGDYTRETPFWDSIGSSDVTSISIKRLVPPSDPRFKSKPSGYVVFRASLSDDLDGMQISNWLKTNAPTNVSAVSIEVIVLKARRLQRNLDQNAFPKGSFLRNLSQPAQLEALKKLQYLDTVMATAAKDAQNTLVDGDGETIGNTLNAIKHGVEAAKTSIETPLLLEGKKTTVEETVDDDTTLLQDTLNSISLHSRMTDSAIATDRGASFEIPRGEIHFRSSEERFVKGRWREQDIIIDFFEYIPNRDGAPQPDTIKQLEKMAELLCHSKDLGFHILHGIGFVHEKVKDRFGMIFQLGPKQRYTHMPPITLQSLYALHKRMSLSRRIEIAHAIVTAVENLHRVEWIHKAIRSDNIGFFLSPRAHSDSTDDGADLDLSSPWLFGFEYARAIDSGTKLEEDHSEIRNLYRHPQRWSRPQVKSTRAHDVYSLGVVLMEIADWRQVSDIVKRTARSRSDTESGERSNARPINSEECRRILEDKVKRDFAHQIGDVFTGVIAACFEFESKAEGLDAYGMQTLFQASILDPMQRILGSV